MLSITVFGVCWPVARAGIPQDPVRGSPPRPCSKLTISLPFTCCTTSSRSIAILGGLAVIRRPARRSCRIRTPTPVAAAGRPSWPAPRLPGCGGGPAESEEVVVNADACQIEHVTPDLGEDLFGGGTRSDELRPPHRRASAAAANARRSTFPFDVCGRPPIQKTAGTIAVESQSRRNCRSSAVVGAGSASPPDVGDQPGVATAVAPATTAFSRTPWCLASPASISPGSIRTPRIFT